ncbi:MAG: hypothetical protein R2764_18560 [Bacteroidales bacterium]
MDALLNGLGFIKLQTTDQTRKAKQFISETIDKYRKQGSSPPRLNFFMGKTIMKKFGNLLKALEENKIELQSGIYKKKIMESK